MNHLLEPQRDSFFVWGKPGRREADPVEVLGVAVPGAHAAERSGLHHAGAAARTRSKT